MALPKQPHRAEPADGPSSEDRIARRHPVSSHGLRPWQLLRLAEHITANRGGVNGLGVSQPVGRSYPSPAEQTYAYPWGSFFRTPAFANIRQRRGRGSRNRQLAQRSRRRSCGGDSRSKAFEEIVDGLIVDDQRRRDAQHAFVRVFGGDSAFEQRFGEAARGNGELDADQQAASAHLFDRAAKRSRASLA